MKIDMVDNTHIFDKFNREIVELQYYKSILDDIEENTILIMDISPTFFQAIHHCIMITMLISIVRFSDRERAGQFTNLSINYLKKHMIDIIKEEEDKKTLSEKITAFDNTIKPLKKLRNKYIGHLDLETFLNLTDIGVTRKEIFKCLSILCDIRNIFQKALYDSTTSNIFIRPLKGTDFVFKNLELGREYRVREYMKKRGKDRKEVESILYPNSRM